MFKLQDLNQLANKYGSPFFIYKESTLQKRARMLQDAVSPKIEVFYSMKANPNPFILRVFKDMGLGVEVASKGELSVALEVGFDPKKIFLPLLVRQKVN